MHVLLLINDFLVFSWMCPQCILIAACYNLYASLAFCSRNLVQRKALSHYFGPEKQRLEAEVSSLDKDLESTEVEITKLQVLMKEVGVHSVSGEEQMSLPL